MKKLSLIIGAVIIMLNAEPNLTIDLPKPLTSGGTGIFTLLEKRASGLRNNFPTGAVSQEELATILWAATGRNRGGKGWTVPVGMGRPPHVDIYVVNDDGAYLYQKDNHKLELLTDSRIAGKNLKAEVTPDKFVENSSAILVFVADTAANKYENMDNILAGAMSQNVYLAADALGIKTRYLVTLNEKGIRKELKLKKTDVPLCVMPLGK